MEYSKYNKTMVLLSEENRDFAARAEQPIYGNLRIETGNNKGAISLSIQNLRFFDRNRYIYKLILFGEKRERTIHTVVGTLILNKFGTGENYFRFDPSNVDGRGNRLEDYSVAIVAAVSMRDNKESLHPVLKGRLAAAGSVMAATTAENQDRPSKGISQQEFLQKAKLQEESQNLEDTIQENRERDRENPTGKSSGAKFKEELPVQKYNRFYNDYVRLMCEKTVKASELYDNISPFSKDRTRAKWKKIVNVKNMPMVSPGAAWGASKYRHYIFGEGEDFYYIGVPGRFINEEQPEAGKSGFVLWQPIVGAESLDATKEDCTLENRMTAYGYWIAAICKDTGDIVDPV